MAHSAPLLDIGHLQLVDAVVRAGTVTRAASDLHVTQPAVSHRLRELEARLGARLFHRSGRRMTLTAEGARLLASARAVLVELERLATDLGQHRTGHRGTLRVATECYLCYNWLPGTFTRLASALPHVDLRIVPEATRDPMPALLDRTLDLAIVYGVPDDPRVVTRELFRDELVAIVSAGHRLARKAFLAAGDFEGETFVCHFADRRGVFDAEVLEPAGVKLARVLEMQLTVAVVEMVRTGLGFSVLPRWALPEGLARRGVAIKRITKRGLFRTWHAAVLREQAARPATATLVELLAEQLSTPAFRARCQGRQS